MKVSRNSGVALVTAMAMAMLTVVTLPTVAQAQTDLKVNIPFSFYVGTQELPPGDYTVRVSGMYVRISDNNRHSAFVLTNQLANPEARTLGAGKLMFVRYGSYLFLSEVRRGGYTASNGLIKSNLETKVAKEVGASQPVAYAASN
jgi:hypothetical protein